jgi:hypothetical protein
MQCAVYAPISLKQCIKSARCRSGLASVLPHHARLSPVSRWSSGACDGQVMPSATGNLAVDNNHHVAGKDMCVGVFVLLVFEME